MSHPNTFLDVLKKLEWENECLVWTGHRVRKYGRVTLKNKHYITHRLIFQSFIEAIPPGLYVCHHCDNPSCVRPDHLFLGTQFENMKDMKNKKREIKAVGEANSHSKLTNKDILEIRKSSLSYRILSEKFGVCISTVFRAKKIKTWKHLEDK